MGQFNLATPAKASMEDAEAANTATQQNKTNTKVNVDPKIVIKSVKGTKNGVSRAFRYYLCIFLISSLALGGYVLYVKWYNTCETFEGPFIEKIEELKPINVGHDEMQYRRILRSYELLRIDYLQLNSKYTELNNSLYECERRDARNVDTFRNAFDDLYVKSEKCKDFVLQKGLTVETVLTEITDSSPEDQKSSEVIHTNTNDKISTTVQPEEQTK